MLRLNLLATALACVFASNISGGGEEGADEVSVVSWTGEGGAEDVSAVSGAGEEIVVGGVGCVAYLVGTRRSGLVR